MEQAQLVLAALGVRPASELAAASGLFLGPQGAIQVNRRMETSVPGVYAAGDCAQTWHRLLKRSSYLPLGTTAHRQGRIAGENAVGGQIEYEGSVGTQVVTIFDLAVARTGLLEAEASAEGYAPRTEQVPVLDHNPYYPGAQELTISLMGDQRTGLLLGAQIIGNREAQVAKRIDILAIALHQHMQVREIIDLDLSYAPPVASPWDPVQKAAMAWLRGSRECPTLAPAPRAASPRTP
jgi:NADPH-dependent 2,4-dienoyl-CoA reductase/sulfur reductase-like enzyme